MTTVLVDKLDKRVVADAEGKGFTTAGDKLSRPQGVGSQAPGSTMATARLCVGQTSRRRTVDWSDSSSGSYRACGRRGRICANVRSAGSLRW